MLVENIDSLRHAYGEVQNRHPFETIAICILPDHLHAVWTLASEEVFAVSRPGNIVKLPVSINGTRGFFVLDTGATFVSMKNTFAQKAKVTIDADSAVQLHTANGMTTAKRRRAQTIQLRSLQAKDVPVVVQDDAKGIFGEGVDGLLGMSFLSRFKLTVDARSVSISGRK